FNNQQLDWHDIKHFRGMAKETIDFRERAATDPEFKEIHGSEPLWVSTLFSGMPAFQTSMRYSGDVLKPLTSLFWLGLPRPANYVFLTFLGFYFLLLTLRVNPWLSGIGAAAFALSSYFFIILTVGHTSKAQAIALFAPVLAGVLMTYRGKVLLGSAVSAFTLALQIHSNHYQITYYLAIVLLILGITFGIDAIRQKTLPTFFKASAALIIAAMIGVLPNIGKLWTTNQYAEYTMRGKAELAEDRTDKEDGLDKGYALEYSYGVMETFTFLVPNFYGGPSVIETDTKLRRKFNGAERLPAYWGEQRYTAGPVYIGAIVCFLFVLGLTLVQGPIKWWLLAASVLGIMLSWGNNFLFLTDLFFYYFPLYNKFRAVSMFLVVAEITMPILGILGLQQFLNQEGHSKDQKRKALYIAAGVAGGLALIFALFGGGIFDFTREGEQFNQALVDWRKSRLTGDAFRSFGFILGAAGLLWLTLEERIKSPILYVGLGLLVLLDMLPVSSRYLSNDDYLSDRRYEAIFEPSQADQLILQDTDPNYRVINLAAQDGPFNDAITSYHHKSVGGYHAAKLRRYQDVISRHLSSEIQVLSQSLQQYQQSQDFGTITQSLGQMQVFNMLNTRYFILNPNGQPLQNPAAMGNAWFVNNIRRVNSPDEEISALREVNLRNTAVVDEAIYEGRFGNQIEGFTPRADSTATI
ncbi:MAG: hypothetical protein AAF399_29465, partial [Bacteroidota bacterium]